MRYMFTISMLMLAGVCKNRSAENNIDEPASQECDIFQQNGSEVFLQIIDTDGAISGNLQYAFKEKDKNTGTISGRMKGDTLFATYTFTSEGVQGTRDVVFLKSENSFIEGLGEIN